MKPPTPVELRMAHALMWNMSTAKQSTPRRTYMAQADEHRAMLGRSATHLLQAMRRAGLVVSVKGAKAVAPRFANGAKPMICMRCGTVHANVTEAMNSPCGATKCKGRTT